MRAELERLVAGIGVAEAIARILTRSDWIPVSERLPEHDTRIWATWAATMVTRSWGWPGTRVAAGVATTLATKWARHSPGSPSKSPRLTARKGVESELDRALRQRRARDGGDHLRRVHGAGSCCRQHLRRQG